MSFNGRFKLKKSIILVGLIFPLFIITLIIATNVFAFRCGVRSSRLHVKQNRKEEGIRN